MVGCSFDAFSPSLLDRSYIALLLLLAWLAPMVVICRCYLKIFASVRGGLLMWTEQPSAAEEQRRRVRRKYTFMARLES